MALSEDHTRASARFLKGTADALRGIGDDEFAARLDEMSDQRYEEARVMAVARVETVDPQSH